MKPCLPRPTRGLRAFTFTEVMISSGLFTLLIGSLVGLSMYGLRIHQVSEIKANASDAGRAALSCILDDIQTCRIARIGNMKDSRFQEVPDGQAQRGDAIQLQYTTDTNLFIFYFLDEGDHSLRRRNSVAKTDVAIAQYVNRDKIFQAEDHLGTLLTNAQNNRVIRVRMEFYQTVYPVVTIGPSNLIDYYKLEACATRRTLE